MASDEDIIKNHFLVCKCQSSKHITRFMSCDLDDEIIYIETSLISHKSFFKRLVASIKLYAYLSDKIK
jgi:hypothetical protein